jgi:hypothetical protein
VRPSGFFATEAFAQNDTGAACFFCVILSAAKDLARQRVTNIRLRKALLEAGVLGAITPPHSRLIRQQSPQGLRHMG